MLISTHTLPNNALLKLNIDSVTLCDFGKEEMTLVSTSSSFFKLEYLHNQQEQCLYLVLFEEAHPNSLQYLYKVYLQDYSIEFLNCEQLEFFPEDMSTCCFEDNYIVIAGKTVNDNVYNKLNVYKLNENEHKFDLVFSRLTLFNIFQAFVWRDKNDSENFLLGCLGNDQISRFNLAVYNMNFSKFTLHMSQQIIDSTFIQRSKSKIYFIDKKPVYILLETLNLATTNVYRINYFGEASNVLQSVEYFKYIQAPLHRINFFNNDLITYAERDHIGFFNENINITYNVRNVVQIYPINYDYIALQGFRSVNIFKVDNLRPISLIHQAIPNKLISTQNELCFAVHELRDKLIYQNTTKLLSNCSMFAKLPRNVSDNIINKLLYSDSLNPKSSQYFKLNLNEEYEQNSLKITG